MPEIYRFPYRRTSDPYSPHFYKFRNYALMPVGLQKNGGLTKPQAFIDSGSQYCLFIAAYAKYLGIKNYKDVEKGKILPIVGIGGNVENRAYFHTADLLIYKTPNNTKSHNAVVVKDIEVGFCEKDFVIGGVLGVYGFLDRFRVELNIPKASFALETLFEANG